MRHWGRKSSGFSGDAGRVRVLTPRTSARPAPRLTLPAWCAWPTGSLQLLMQGLARIQIQQLVHTDPYPLARVRSLPDPSERSTALEGQARGALSLFQEVVNLAPYLPPELGSTAARLPEPGILADFIAPHLNLKLEERQAILDTLDVTERLR